MTGGGDGALAAVTVPATTANLGPGFDAFGIALELRVTVRAVARTEQRVSSTGAGSAGLPTDDDNLVWRALTTACSRFGWDEPDVSLQVHTPVPQARGLGSSSAAIVAGIALARVLAGADGSVRASAAALGDPALTRLAAELEGHPDNVAPAVHGGMVACATTDDGELVVRLHPPPGRTRPVVLVPATTSLTSDARAVVPDQLPRADVVEQAARAGHVLAGMTGAWPVDPRLAGDRLHEPRRVASLGPGAPLLAQLRGRGRHVWLSGAGPSLAAAVRVRDAAAVEQLRELASEHDHELVVLDWDRQGIRSCVPDGCGLSGSDGCADCPLSSSLR